MQGSHALPIWVMGSNLFKVKSDNIGIERIVRTFSMNIRDHINTDLRPL